VAMLDEGTSTRNALQIADEAARLGATLTTSSSMDSSQVTVTSLLRQFPKALELMSDVVLHPTFPQDEVERQRASRLANLVAQKSNPAQIAQRVMASAVFGPNHPYGYLEAGTEASNKVLTRDAMIAFWKQHIVPGNAALVVVGAVSRAELETLATHAFSDWTGKAPSPPTMPTTRQASGKLIIVDTPGAAQTQVRVAGVGARRTTPDYEATEIMNMVLGGLFTSRINLNLREDKGYTYGAFSTFAFRKEPGPFFVSSGIRTDATAPAVNEILAEIRKMRDAEITVDELSLGRDSLVRSLPGRFEQSQQAAATLSALFVYRLGLDYYSQYVERLLGVDVAAVHAAARKYLQPDQLIVVAVGDRQKIEADLKNLKLGDVEYRDSEGMVLPGASTGGAK
jgi:zinc protease